MTQPDSSTRTERLDTYSIRLLRERIENFSIVEYVDRWRRYELGRELGRGGMGVVYKAIDKELKRQVALKCTNDDDGGDREIVERFLDEIQLHARLTHPSIAPIYDFGLTDEGHLFMAMEVVFGESLEILIKRYHERSADGHERVHLTDLLTRFTRVCDAMSFAHRVGVIHRDLKPENVICGEFGEVFVMDWGLATTIQPTSAINTDTTRIEELTEATAKEREAARDEIKRLVEEQIEKRRVRETQKVRRQSRGKLPTVSLAHQSLMGSVVGTIGYMSPEQALGRNDSVDHRSDTYALGSILYHLLCGKPPIEGGGNNVWDALDAVIDGRIVPPDQRGSARRVPDALARIAMKALSRDPKDRFNDSAELRREIQDWVRRQTMSSYVLLEIEETLGEAKAQLEAGRPKDAKLLLSGSLDRLQNIDGAEGLRRQVERVIESANEKVAEQDERDEALRSFRELHEAIIESQFGLVLSYLRLPAPTIRRAHDRVFKALQKSGVWHDPKAALARFERFKVHQDHAISLTIDLREHIILAMFLFAWVSTRMSMVTSKEHGKDVFQRHAEMSMLHLRELAPSYRSTKLNAARMARLKGEEGLARSLEILAEKVPVQGASDHIFLATLHFFDYELNEALEHVRSALDLDPGAFWGHALLIFIYSGNGDRESTFAALRTCQALQPREPILWTIKGFLLREYGLFEDAHTALDRALRYRPGDPLARLIRADLRLRLGRIDWQRDLDTAADLVMPPKHTWDYFVLALISLYKKDYEYAVEFVKAAQKRSPGMPQLYGIEASIYLRMGEFEKGEKLLREALEMSPNDPRLVESLMALLVYQRRFGEARTQFLDDESRRPGAATPSVLLLGARSFAGYADGADNEESSDEQMAMMLIFKAARSGVIAEEEVLEVDEFKHLVSRPDFARVRAMLRAGPAAPRLFQPAIGDNPDRVRSRS